MAYDTARGTTVLFGGYNGPYNGETWELAFPVIYVNATATGTGTGSSWASAFKELRDAIAFAAANSFVREVWVARGTYTPSPPLGQGGSRSDSFNLRNNLAIYGGFVGTETSLSQRPPLPTNATDALDPTKATVLSGDLNGDDVGADALRSDNSIHVVQATGTNTTAALDGVTVSGGWATAEPASLSMSDSLGGGVYCTTSMSVQNSVLYQNRASYMGGGIFMRSGVIAGCRFYGNSASGTTAGVRFGGAVGIPHDTGGNTAISNSVFEQNVAQGNGGAIWQGGTTTLDITACVFRRNTCTGAGGAVHTNQDGASGGGPTEVFASLFIGNSSDGDGGAIWGSSYAAIALYNCLLAGNAAGSQASPAHGGALSCSSATISNCTIANNQGEALYGRNPGSTVAFVNSVVWGNGTAGTLAEQVGGPGTVAPEYTSIQGWNGSFGGTGNNGLNPQFLRTPGPGPDGVWGTPDDFYDFKLSPGSPAIDSGNTLLALQTPFDLTGLARFFDHPSVTNTGVGTPPVDRGCYENQYCPECPDPRRWINASGGNYIDADNWTLSVPGPSHDAIFDLDATYDVIFPASTVKTNLSTNIVRGNVAWRLPTTSTYTLSATTKTALNIGTIAGAAPSLTMSGPGGGAGGSFRPASVSIANDPDAFGTLTVTGAGTKLTATSQSITVGLLGDGVFNVLAGAKVVAPSVTLGQQASATGAVLIDGTGSSLSAKFGLQVFAGSLTVRNGGSLSTPFGQTVLFQNGTLFGNGSVSGDVINFGTVAPGNSPGTLTISGGDFTQVGADPDFGNASGQLLMEVTGTLSGQYDQLIIQNGLTELGGGLVVKAPGDQLAVPAEGVNVQLVKALGGINNNSRFDVVFLPKATVPSGEAQQCFKVDYALTGPGPAAAVNMVNLPLGAGLTVQDPTNAGATGTPTAAASADLDGDGLSDLILTFNGNTANDPGQVLILLNLGADPGDATAWLGFGGSQTLNVGVNPTDITVFDIDGDGLSDIAVSNAGSNSVSLFKNRVAINAGTNSRVANFEAKGSVAVGTGPTGLTIDSFAGGPTLGGGGGGGGRSMVGEHRPVLITANEGAGDALGNVSIALSDSDDPFNFITFPPIFLLPTGKIPFKPAPINVDSDRRPDLAILCRDGSALVVFPNNSTGPTNVAFGEASVIPVDANPVALGVVNLNGEEGLATVNRPTPTTGTMSVVVNHTPANETGSNTRTFDLAPAVNLDAGQQPRSIAPVDLEGDQDDDLAVLTKLSPTSTKVRIFRNDFRVGANQVNAQPTLVNDKDVPELGTTDPLFVLRANLVPNSRPDLLTILASPGTGAKGLTSDGKGGLSATAASSSTIQNLRRIRNDTPAAAGSCPLDYNLDTVINPDDLGDYITDYFTSPHVPGPGGYAIPCPGNDPPYNAGYKAAYTPDGSGQCNPPFPDNLGDFITAYFSVSSCG